MKKYTRKTNYKEKGITLIALVVTIIVLLVLAGVTINLVLGQNGLIGKAQQASNTMANATANEITQMAEYANEIDELTAGFKAGGSEQGGGEEVISTATYTQGELVTYKGEKFYALNDVASTDTTMEIFAYTNIDRDTCTAQVNLPYSQTECAFSSQQYWGDTPGQNLNNVTGYATGDVMDKVNKYAGDKGAISGRLLTKDEVESLAGADLDSYQRWESMTNTTIKNMINGAGNEHQGFEYYWLGSGGEESEGTVWVVSGQDSGLFIGIFERGNFYGVRPVLTVYKSYVSPAFTSAS